MGRWTGPHDPWFGGVARAVDSTLGAWWSDRHDQAGELREVNAVARHRRTHPQSETYIDRAQRQYTPIDAPRQGTRDDVRDTSFHGTYTEKRSLWRLW